MEKVKLAIDYPLQLLRRPAVQKVTSALFTQSMLSITNFIVGIVVAKYAAKSEYGVYVILFSIIGIAGSYQNALINSPLTVLAPKKEHAEEVRFLSGLGVGQWLFFIPLTVVTLVGAALYATYWYDYSILYYAIALSIATLTYLLREFVRTVHYSKLRMQLLVKMDAFFVFSILLGMWAIVFLNRVTSTSSIWVLGFGYLAAAIFGNYSARDVYRITWESIRSAFRETWQYSRWALLGVTSDIFKNRGYIYIVSFALGLDKIAEISAARLFLMPVGLLVASSGKITLAKGADILNTKGSAQFKKFSLSILCFLALVWGCYFAFLWMFHDYLISFLGEKYRAIEPFLLLWGIFFLVYSLRFPVTNSLQVCKEFKPLANYDVVVAIITVLSCLILIEKAGARGAIISLIAGEMVLLSLSAMRLLKYLHQYDGREKTPD